MGSSSCCAQCFRFLFALINCLFLIIGLGIIAVGIYSIIAISSYDFISGSRYASGSIILIVCGVVTAVIAGLGCVGACFKWRPLLVVYMILLALIVILELAAGILGLVYRNKVYDTSESAYSEGWEKAMNEYVENDNGAIQTVDALQKNLKCCGGNNYTDWLMLNGTDIGIPLSCKCPTVGKNCESVSYYINGTSTTMNVYSDGCVDATLNFARAIAYVIGGVGVAFGIFELIGVFIAIGLVIWISKSKDGYQVV